MDEEPTQPLEHAPSMDPLAAGEPTVLHAPVAAAVFDGQSGELRPRRGWALSANALIVALAATTAGALGWAIVERSRAGDTRRELDAAREHAADLDGRLGELRATADQQAADLNALRSELDAAGEGAAATQAALDADNEQLATVAARDEQLVALFPVTSEAIAGAELAGTYALTNTPGTESCTGFGDPAATCVAANFPPDLQITGTTAGGYAARSSWFGEITLARDGAGWRASGAVVDTVSNTCNGAPNPTTIELRVEPAGVLPAADASRLVASGVRGTTTLTSPATTDCVATARSAEFVSG